MNSPVNNKGLISCIIPVYNREELIVECLDSVLAQTYHNYEILIVDDGSTDKTAEVVEKLIQKQPASINCLTQANQGPGVARQTGLNNANGEYIQFLDSDDLIKPSKFELYINEFNSAYSPDIVFGITHYYQKENPDEFIVWKKDQQQSTSILPDFLTSRAWSTSTPIYRRSLLTNAGSILPLSCEEDLEYDCRIGLQSPKIKFVNLHLTDFRGHRGQRFSVNNSDRTRQLTHQIQAREGIYQTIEKSNLAKTNPHVKVFAQSLFLVSRQAGEIGLTYESNQALKIAQSVGSMLSLKDKLAMGVYRFIRLIAGVKHGSLFFNTIYDRMHQIKNKSN